MAVLKGHGFVSPVQSIAALAATGLFRGHIEFFQQSCYRTHTGAAAANSGFTAVSSGAIRMYSGTEWTFQLHVLTATLFGLSLWSKSKLRNRAHESSNEKDLAIYSQLYGRSQQVHVSRLTPIDVETRNRDVANVGRKNATEPARFPRLWPFSSGNKETPCCEILLE